MRVVVADDVHMLYTRRGDRPAAAGRWGRPVVAQAEDTPRPCCGEVRKQRGRTWPSWISRCPPTHTDEGLIAARTIRADHPQIGVLLLSQYVEPSYAMRLIEDHPERVGYLLKERVFDIATVVDALRRIVDGGKLGHRPDDRRPPPGHGCRRTDPLAGLHRTGTGSHLALRSRRPLRTARSPPGCSSPSAPSRHTSRRSSSSSAWPNHPASTVACSPC